MADAPPALAALAETGLVLARRSAGGRVLFGRLAGLVHPDQLPGRLRGPVRAELEAAHRATATPLDPKAVERALKGAWGRAPARVLDNFDPRAPLAVSPTAQVHAGTHEDGPVAVKVARPGLAASIRSELALLDALAPPLGAAFRALDVAAALREVREAALDELDLEHEGDQQQRVRRALRRVDGLVVPAVRAELTGEGVLATERLAGEPLDRARPADPGTVARRLVEAHLTAWRDTGLVLTDARPSHVLVLADGRTGLLGTGVARPASRDRAAAATAAFAALADPDPDAFARVVSEDLAVLDAETAREAHGVLRDVLGDLVTGGPARLDGPALADCTRRAFDRLGDLLRLAARATPQPSDLAALRMLGQLAATLSRLEATDDWTALAASAVQVS